MRMGLTNLKKPDQEKMPKLAGWTDRGMSGCRTREGMAENIGTYRK